ncbi:penicillin-binding transpeptidase domain-containing protein, partial [Streptomyces sp. WI03-5b]
PQDTPDLTASPSIALGPATASVVDMASAYATLADHGRQRPHTLVSRISKNAEELDLPERTTRRAVSREAADTTTSVLRSVVDGGTGTAAQGSGRPAAGKTGTAEEDKAAWFAGYTPDLATVIAVMGQDPETGVQKPLYGALGLARMNGGGAPAETWADYTRAALEGSPVQAFDLQADEGPEEPDPDESGDPDGSDDTEEAGGTRKPRDREDTDEPGTADSREERRGTRTRTPDSPSEASRAPR